MKVKLFTRTGGLVLAMEIPPFSEPPDVIVWGERIFCIPDVDRDLFVHDLPHDETGYVEAFTYAIPSGEPFPVIQRDLR